MEKKKWFSIILLLATFFVITVFNNIYFNTDFAAFDRPFIPPLALTNAGKQKPSMKGMKILKTEWRALKTKYYGANPADTQWKEDFDKIEKIV